MSQPIMKRFTTTRAKNTVVSTVAPQSFALIRRQNGQFGNIHRPLLKKNWSSFGLC